MPVRFSGCKLPVLLAKRKAARLPVVHACAPFSVNAERVARGRSSDVGTRQPKRGRRNRKERQSPHIRILYRERAKRNAIGIGEKLSGKARTHVRACLS